VSSGLRRRSEKNSFSNASWLSVRISSAVIIREPPNHVKWAKASIRKKFIFHCKLALGSHLELYDNKRAPEPRRMGLGIDQKKKLFFQCKCALGSNLELGDNKRAPEPLRVG
jgi:hypothetical protein